jgi:hypothetical protein
VFPNFLCKYSNRVLPYNFEQVEFIMDECKKEKVDRNLDLVKVNIKNKAILVKGENMDKQFESIKDTIQYFNTL